MSGKTYTEKTAGGRTYRFNTAKTAVEALEGEGASARWTVFRRCRNSAELDAAWAALDGAGGGGRTAEDAAPSGAGRGDPEPVRLFAGAAWTRPETGELYEAEEDGGRGCEACDLHNAGRPDACALHLVDGMPACYDRVTGDGKALILRRRPADGASGGRAADGASGGRAANYLPVPAARIRESPFQVREIDEGSEAFLELVASVRSAGLINPVRLRPLGGGVYELVAGHRRFRACRAAGVDPVPATVLDLSDTEAEVALVVENAQRQDLTPLEQADSVAALLGRGLGERETARRLGVSEKWVYRRRVMARCTPEWRAFAREVGAGAEFVEAAGRLPEAVAAEVLAEARNDFYCRQGDARGIDAVVRGRARRLEESPWAESRPGWCEGCARRSDAAGAEDLFGAFGGEGPGGAPRCLDPACWKGRTAALVRELKGELKAAHGQILTTGHSGTYLYAKDRSRKNCVPVLVTDGPQAGRTLWAPKPGPEAKGEKRFEPTDETLRQAAFAEAAEAAAAELCAGKRRGGESRAADPALALALALAYGMDGGSLTAAGESEGGCAERLAAAASPGELAAAAMAAVSEVVQQWPRKAEEIVSAAVRERSARSVEERFRSACALARTLGLDDGELDRAAEKVRRRLACRAESGKARK